MNSVYGFLLCCPVTILTLILPSVPCSLTPFLCRMMTSLSNGMQSLLPSQEAHATPCPCIASHPVACCCSFTYVSVVPFRSVSHVLNEHIVSSRGRCNPAEYQDFNLNCDQLVCGSGLLSILPFCSELVVLQVPSRLCFPRSHRHKLCLCGSSFIFFLQAVCSADPASIDAIYQFISAIFINCQVSQYACVALCVGINQSLQHHM